MAERIPEQLVSDIIASSDIADVISRYTALKRSGSSMIGLCPFHKEKTPSFHVSPDRQLYYCFGCGAGGNVIGFIKQIENLDYVEALKFLAERVNITIPETGISEIDKQRHEQKQRIYDMNRLAAKFFRQCLLSPEGEKAQNYIEGRKLYDKTVITYGIGYAPDSFARLTDYLVSKGFHRDELVVGGISGKSQNGKVYDRFRNRLMFPIIDTRGNILGFGGRLLEGDGAKYLNTSDTPVFNKRHNLYSLNFAKNFANGELILMEGYMDVISLYQSGIKNSIASLGTALTNEQARLISRFAGTVILCYDTDDAGIKATQRAIEVFEGINVKIKILNLPDGKDPDEFVKKNGGKAFEDLCREALTVGAYKLMMLEKMYDLSNQGQVIDYVNEAAKVLAGVANSVERDVLTKQISEKTGVKSIAIEKETGRGARSNAKKTQREAIRESIKKVKISYNKDKTAKLIVAERNLISLLCRDKAMFLKYKDMVVGDFFTEEIHRTIVEKYSENPSADPSVMISDFSDEDAAQAAAALGMPLNFEDNQKAAEELIRVISEEKYNYLINKAIKEKDTVTLNRLIMEKNKR